MRDVNGNFRRVLLGVLALLLPACAVTARPQLPQPPAPRAVAFTVWAADAAVRTGTVWLSVDQRAADVPCQLREDGGWLCSLPPDVPAVVGAWLHIENVEGYQPFAQRFAIFVSRGAQGLCESVETVFGGCLDNVSLTPQVPAVPRRTGLVRGVGQVYVDDTGPFRPKGQTFLWGLYGWHGNDRDRVRANLAWASAKGTQYVRVCASVNWPGEAVDPTWPDYVEQLGSLIDAAYDDYGLRVKITTICGGPWDALDIARKVVAAVQGRQQKVFSLEATNEGNLDEASTVEVAKILLQSGVPLVSVGMGDQGVETIRRASAAAGATKIDLHTERDAAEDGARQVRQAWDFRPLLGRLLENAEPPGPASTVGELTDPFKLGTFRTLSIMIGAGAFDEHTGTGVYGRPNVASNGSVRQANLWETPNIDALTDAVYQAGEWLPDGIENWGLKNNEKYKAAIWAEGALNKFYGTEDGTRFVYMAVGVTGATTIQAQRALTVRVRHPVTGDVLATYELAAGQSVSGSSLWAYVLEGAVR